MRIGAKMLKRRRQSAAKGSEASGSAARLGAAQAASFRAAAPRSLALALLVVASYLPALSGGFIWDDVIFVEEPLVRSPAGLLGIWFSPSEMQQEGHYWPLVYTTFWLEHKLWGLAPAGYHAVNVALHLLNCLLLWRLLAHLAVPGAWAVAAVFAVHPVHVESVAWIIERKDVLSALFYLGAVMAWVRFTERPRAGPYGLALALMVAGLLSKSVVATLPVALGILQWWRHGRLTAATLLQLAPFFVVAAGITAADLMFYQSREPLELGYTLVERLLIAAQALWFYVGKLLWPTELAVIYPLWEIDAADLLAWAQVAAAAALPTGLWLARRRIGRGPLAGTLYFAVTLSPVLGFVDYGYMQFSLVADRFQYLAGIGLLAVLVGAAAQGAGQLPEGWRRQASGVAVVVVVTLLGALTWQQAGLYRDEHRFFSHILAHNPEARGAHHNLGRVLLTSGRPEEALAATRIAVGMRPDFPDAHSNLGLALRALQRPDEAEQHFRRALELDPRHLDARYSLANIRRDEGNHEAAADGFRAVLDIEPEHTLAHAGLGVVLHETGNHEAAIASLSRALALQPELPEAGPLHGIMGLSALALGRSEAAAVYFTEALGINSYDSVALGRLAAIRSGQGRWDEALGLHRRLAATGLADARTQADIALALHALGRLEEARLSFEQALSLDPDLAAARVGLAQVREALRNAESSR